MQAETSGHNKDSYPKWSVIAFEFPANGKRPAVKVFWYDGGKRPPAGVVRRPRDRRQSGALLVGEKGKIYSPGDYGDNFQCHRQRETCREIEFVHSPGHFEEWVRAIKGGEPAMSNFPDYAGPLTETILLGNLAVWAADKGEEKVEWDAENLKATNAPELEPLIRPEYHQGYSL